MSSTHTVTTSRDGRFLLRYRRKDSWGDHAVDEERWRLIDARFGSIMATWSNEGDRDFAGVAFAPDGVRVEHADGRVETVALPVSRELTAEEHALRAAVFDAPDDDAPRSIYADWLLQRGDPRGELIALQLAGRDATALIEQHRFAWLCDDRLPLTNDAAFVRGFVEELALQVFEPEPLAALLAAPAIACLTRLDMSFSRFGDRILAQLATSPRLGRLRRLDLFCSDVSDAGLATLATQLAGLAQVTLGAHRATEPGLAALRAARPGLAVS